MHVAGRPRVVRTLSDLVDTAKGAGPLTVAIAGAEDPEVLLAAFDAADAGIARPLLVGRRDRVEDAAARAGVDLGRMGAEVVEVRGSGDHRGASAREAVELVRAGRAKLLMKGRIDSAEMLRAVLDRDAGLRASGLLSHVALMEAPGFGRLLYVSDGGVVLAPGLEEKVEILRNVIAVAHTLGLSEPRAAVLSSSELVSPEVQSTVDAAALAKMAERGQIVGALVDGPLALDNAVSPDAANAKGIGGPVAGRADILLVPGVEAGNLMCKAISFIGRGHMAGVVVGATVPVVLASRADHRETKLFSLALGVILAARGAG